MLLLPCALVRPAHLALIVLLPPALPLAWLSGVAGRLMKLPEGRDPEDDALALPGVYT